jgi:hypothetical protein
MIKYHNTQKADLCFGTETCLIVEEKGPYHGSNSQSTASNDGGPRPVRLWFMVNKMA